METVIIEFEGQRVEVPVIQVYPDGDVRVKLPNGRQEILRLEKENDDE